MHKPARHIQHVSPDTAIMSRPRVVLKNEEIIERILYSSHRFQDV
jgi:hypothetical protein